MKVIIELESKSLKLNGVGKSSTSFFEQNGLKKNFSEYGCGL